MVILALDCLGLVIDGGVVGDGDLLAGVLGRVGNLHHESIGAVALVVSQVVFHRVIGAGQHLIAGLNGQAGEVDGQALAWHISELQGEAGRDRIRNRVAQFKRHGFAHGRALAGGGLRLGAAHRALHVHFCGAIPKRQNASVNGAGAHDHRDGLSQGIGRCVAVQEQIHASSQRGLVRGGPTIRVAASRRVQRERIRGGGERVVGLQRIRELARHGRIIPRTGLGLIELNLRDVTIRTRGRFLIHSPSHQISGAIDRHVPEAGGGQSRSQLRAIGARSGLHTIHRVFGSAIVHVVRDLVCAQPGAGQLLFFGRFERDCCSSVHCRLGRVGGTGAERHAGEKGGRSCDTREKLLELHEKLLFLSLFCLLQLRKRQSLRLPQSANLELSGGRLVAAPVCPPRRVRRAEHPPQVRRADACAR